MSSYVIPVFPAASRVPPRDALAARLAELTGRFAELSAELAAISSAVDSVSGKADKAPPAAAGNLASLDASGNLADSGATPESIKAAAVAEVVANAPETLDTLKEIADILGSPQESGTVLKRISDLESGKADSSSLAAVATSGSYDDLQNKPVIRSVDSSLSATSKNPVQNKVVKGALDGKVAKGGDTMTGGLTVPNLTVGSRASGSAVGSRSVAEGSGNTASAIDSHAEGGGNTASGAGSHSEGHYTTAHGSFSHAEGSYTMTDASYSHAEGGYTMTRNQYEHAQGVFNDSHSVAGSNFGYKGNTLSSVGFGTADGARRNAVETMQDGKTFVYGVGGYDGTNPTGSGVKDLVTAVNDKADASDLPYALVSKTPVNGAVTLSDRAVNLVNPTVTALPPVWEWSDGLDHGQLAYGVIDYGDYQDYGWGFPGEGGTLSAYDSFGNYYGYVPDSQDATELSFYDYNTDGTLVASLVSRYETDVSSLVLPPAITGKSRDFMVRLAMPENAAMFSWPPGVDFETEDGQMPDVSEPGVYLLAFTETGAGRFALLCRKVQGVA